MARPAGGHLLRRCLIKRSAHLLRRTWHNPARLAQAQATAST